MGVGGRIRYDGYCLIPSIYYSCYTQVSGISGHSLTQLNWGDFKVPENSAISLFFSVMVSGYSIRMSE